MLIFLDLETTGVKVEDEICALSYIAEEQLHSSLLKPSKKLTASSMQIHNITNEMLKDKVIFRKSEIYEQLSLLNSKENILVVHNANFILSMLDSSGLTWQGDVVDTRRCSQHLIQECESYTLQFLRYEFGLYRLEEERAKQYQVRLIAHHSPSDVIHVALLYEYLLELESVENLCSLSQTPVLHQKFSFGKYKDSYIEEVSMMDISYLAWMRENMHDLDEDLLYTLEYYLNQVNA